MNTDTLSNLLESIIPHTNNIIFVCVFFVCLLSLFVVIFLRKKSTVNIYSKYEKVYQVSNIISDDEMSSLPKKSILVELDSVMSETTNKPITIYTKLKINNNTGVSYDLIYHTQHIKFLTAYRNRRWDMAITIANSLKTSYDGGLKQYYTTMINRCQFYKKHPPGNNWNGIWNKTIK